MAIPESKPRTLFSRLKPAFLTGLFVLIPITITILFIKAVIQFYYRIFVPAITLFAGLDTPLPAVWVPVAGTLLALLVIICAGLLTQNVVGRKLIRGWENLVRRVPLVGTVYNLIKDVLETISAYQQQDFQSVVLIEWPRRGAYVYGFITSENKEGFPIAPVTAGRKLYNVFIPTTPNPTSGYLVMLPEDEITPVRLSVEEAVKLIVSGGMVSDKGKTVSSPAADEG